MSKTEATTEEKKEAAYMAMPEALLKLRASDPALAEVLDAFARVDAVYREALKASGAVAEQTLGVANSANVTVTFDNGGPGVSATNR